MAKTHKEILAKLSAAERKEIKVMAAELLEEEVTLKEFRTANNYTQIAIAGWMGVDQSEVSRIENRTDAHLSTLRNYIRAAGGDLLLVVVGKDGKQVVLRGLGEPTFDPNPVIAKLEMNKRDGV